MNFGAVDFLTKPIERDGLVAVLRKVLDPHAGERKRVLERDACRALIGRLFACEREGLKHVNWGRLYKQVAAELDIAKQAHHRGRVMEKLQVRAVAELFRACGASKPFDAVGRPVTRSLAV
jgi:FixJ family two-component response regulator